MIILCIPSGCTTVVCCDEVAMEVFAEKGVGVEMMVYLAVKTICKSFFGMLLMLD